MSRKYAWALEHVNPQTGNAMCLFLGKRICNGREEIFSYCGISEAIPFEDKRSAEIFLIGLNQRLAELGKPELDCIIATDHEWIPHE